MPSIKDILTTNILIPSSDGLPGANPLPSVDTANKLSAVNELNPENTSFEYGLFLKISDSQSVKLMRVQSITGFGMDRENEARPGSNYDYVINLPGPVTYKDLRIVHRFTNDKFFLNWLTNGVTNGGASRADMELHFILPTGKHIVFTLQDAFPTAWWMGPIAVVENEKEFLQETVTISYSGLTYQTSTEKTIRAF